MRNEGGVSCKMSVFDYITAAIVISNVFLHLLGCYLLWKTYQWTTITTQQLFIFNLSLCDTLECLYWVGQNFLIVSYYGKDSKYFDYTFCIHIGLGHVLCMLMMAITFDRLLNIAIGIKYSRCYWRVEWTKKLLIIFWIIGIAMFLLSILLCFIWEPWFKTIESIYYALAQSIAFIIVAFLTYAVIFWKYKKSRDSLRQFQNSGNIEGAEQSSAVQMFRNSRFYVSVLIILTYLLFITIPFCVFVIHMGKGTFEVETTSSKTTTSKVEIMLHLSYTSDAIIYIFLQGDVRKTLFNMIYCCCDQENVAQNRPQFQVNHPESDTAV